MHMHDEVEPTRHGEGAQSLLDDVLKPYKPDCRYLKSASLEYTDDALSSLTDGASSTGLLKAWGQFSIPDSCYIAATGHFNAVEYNICYNQLAYYLLAECIHRHLLAPALDMEYPDYLRRQLSDCLIVEFSSAFRRPIDSLGFQGMVSFDKVKAKSKATFIHTSCGFSDGRGGQAAGNVLLAILHASGASRE